MRENQHEDQQELVVGYINGLKYAIQDEISLLIPDVVDECFELAIRDEEKLKRKLTKIIGAKVVGITKAKVVLEEGKAIEIMKLTIKKIGGKKVTEVDWVIGVREDKIIEVEAKVKD